MFSDWKYLNIIQIKELENELNENNIKLILLKYLNFNNKINQRNQINFILFHFYNYSFCKEEAFNERQISTFISIMNDIFIFDMMNYEPSNTMTNSFNILKNEILRHSVEHPPKSILVFEREQVPKIFQYVTDSYYRRFRLYKYIFCPKVIRTLQQIHPQEVEIPIIFPSLSQSIPITQTVNSSSDSTTNDIVK